MPSEVKNAFRTARIEGLAKGVVAIGRPLGVPFALTIYQRKRASRLGGPCHKFLNLLWLEFLAWLLPTRYGSLITRSATSERIIKPVRYMLFLLPLSEVGGSLTHLIGIVKS
jgi:hypothetical protein